MSDPVPGEREMSDAALQQAIDTAASAVTSMEHVSRLVPPDGGADEPVDDSETAGLADTAHHLAEELLEALKYERQRRRDEGEWSP